MKWFDRWLKKKMHHLQYEDSDGYEVNTKSSGRIVSSESPIGPCINFNIFKASGGYVIQHQGSFKLDPNGSNYTPPSLTLVPDGTNIGETIDQLIVFDALKN